jgi:TolB protein
MRIAARLILVIALLTGAESAEAQWRYRYQPLPGYAHHLKVEAEHLPIASAGLSDSATCRDMVAFASQGSLWTMRLPELKARRLTRPPGANIDGLPAWSPDCSRIAFVRDSGQATSIMEVNLSSLRERTLIDGEGITTDPSYAPDGRSLLYASAAAGDLDLWRLDLSDGSKTRVTSDAGLEVRPLQIGSTIYFVTSETRLFQRNRDQVIALDLATGGREVLSSQNRFPYFRPVATQGGILSLVPNGSGRGLGYLAPNAPVVPVPGVEGAVLSAASFRADSLILSAIAPSERSPGLYLVGRLGGALEPINPRIWDWGVPMASIEVSQAVPSQFMRWYIEDAQGHPFFVPGGRAYFDSQTGRWFSLARAPFILELPHGRYTLTAKAGLQHREVKTIVTRAGSTAQVTFEPPSQPLPGFYAGDHHIHMNWGGTYLLDPKTLREQAEAEQLDIVSVLSANSAVHEYDGEFIGTTTGEDRPVIEVGQEIRPHHTGHIAIINSSRRYAPGYWGPAYPPSANVDALQSDLARAARADGAITAHLHPVLEPKLFLEDGSVATFYASELVPDIVNGDVDLLEISGLWVDEFGTSDLWYALLNAGIAVPATAGTDAFPANVRGMPIGSTRVYVRLNGPFDKQSYYRALLAGESFITTGPSIDLTVSGVRSGGIIPVSQSEQCFELVVDSFIPLERIEILHNGNPIWLEASRTPGLQKFSGCLKLPPAGWLAARVSAPASGQDVSDTYWFAHSNPIWLTAKGSTIPDDKLKALGQLLRVLELGQRQVDETYPGTKLSRLSALLRQTRQRLKSQAAELVSTK